MSEQVDIAAMGRQDRRVDDWVVVIEAKTELAGASFDFGLVQDTLGRLREWHPSCLYNPRRYAIQLHIAAAGPSEALHNAVAVHNLAVRAAGMVNGSLTRAEVLTLDEFEMGLDDEPDVAGPGTAPAPGNTAPGPGAAPVPGNKYGLISDLLYSTTRALLRVSTPAEITDLLVGFVAAVGGSISVGEGHPMAGMVAVALANGQGEPLHAVAETMSVAGLIIERCLPALLEDAGRVRRQLR